MVLRCTDRVTCFHLFFTTIFCNFLTFVTISGNPREDSESNLRGVLPTRRRRERCGTRADRDDGQEQTKATGRVAGGIPDGNLQTVLHAALSIDSGDEATLRPADEEPCKVARHCGRSGTRGGGEYE